MSSTLKSGMLGALCGAVFAVGVGFSIGGWVTNSVATERAMAAANLSVQGILAEICVNQSRSDPNLQRILSNLKTTNAYARPRVIEDAGWAVMPGKSSAKPGIAKLCADRIFAEF